MVKEDITLTSLCDEYPGKHHFIQEKEGFVGMYILVLILGEKHGFWVLVRKVMSGWF